MLLGCVLQLVQQLVKFLIRQLPEGFVFFLLEFAAHQLVVPFTQVYVTRELLSRAEHKAQFVFEVHGGPGGGGDGGEGGGGVVGDVAWRVGEDEEQACRRLGRGETKWEDAQERAGEGFENREQPNLLQPQQSMAFASSAAARALHKVAGAASRQRPDDEGGGSSMPTHMMR